MTTPSCRYEAPPVSFPESETLYIAPPLAQTLGKLRRFFGQIELACDEPYPDILAVSLPAGRLQQLSADLSRVLTAVEMQESKSLLVREGESVALPQLMQTQSLSALFDSVKAAWLWEMMREERLVAHFQPIVHSRVPPEVFGYECLLRGRERDGTLVPPAPIFRAARATGLVLDLDDVARNTAIRLASENRLTATLFINLAPGSLEDPLRGLDSTMRAIEAAGIPPQRIVFEIVESEEITDADYLFDIFAFYREIGFRVAVDDLGAGYNSMYLLTRLRPEFVKLDGCLIRGVDRDPYKSQITAKLLELAQGLHIKTIAEGVETEGEWRWLRERGVDFVQGFLFAAPGCPPPMPQAVDTRQPFGT